MSQQPEIVSSAVFVRSGELVSIGEPVPPELRHAILQNIDFDINAHRVFVSSQLLSSKMLALIVRNSRVYLAVFHSQLPIKIPLAYLLEVADALEDSPTELDELLRLMKERTQFYSSDELSNDFQLRAVTRRVPGVVLEPLSVLVVKNPTESSSLLQVSFRSTRNI